MSMLFNMLSRLVITFLPRSKCLLISWLQSPSAVILELRKTKSATVSPSIFMCAAAAAAKLLQSCPTLWDPTDSSPPGSTIPGILQARTLEWVAISFSNAWKWKVKVKSLSHVWLLVTPWIAAYQAPLSMGFSRQEYWSGLPSPSPIFMCSFYLNSEIQKSGDIWLHLLIWRKNNSCPQKLCNAVNAKDRGWGLKTKLKLTSLPVLSVSTALWGHQFKGLGKLHHLPHRKTIHLSQLKLSHSLK